MSYLSLLKVGTVDIEMKDSNAQIDCLLQFFLRASDDLA